MNAPRTYFSTRLRVGRRTVRWRLRDLFAAPRQTGVLPLAAVLLLVSMLGALVSCRAGEAPPSESVLAPDLSTPAADVARTYLSWALPDQATDCQITGLTQSGSYDSTDTGRTVEAWALTYTYEDPDTGAPAESPEGLHIYLCYHTGQADPALTTLLGGSTDPDTESAAWRLDHRRYYPLEDPGLTDADTPFWDFDLEEVAEALDWAKHYFTLHPERFCYRVWFDPVDSDLRRAEYLILEDSGAHPEDVMPLFYDWSPREGAIPEAEYQDQPLLLLRQDGEWTMADWGAPPAPAAPSPTVSLSSSPPTEENQDARTLYVQALTALLEENRLPGDLNDPAGYTGTAADRDAMTKNLFAVCDVDGDDREELVIQYLTAAMVAGMQALIYDTDETGGLCLQFSDFPNLTFYDNGAIQAGWSHNQGLAGAFWPYTLYVYNPETDRYRDVGSVDAWSRDYQPEGYPADTDTSGTGFVYYLYRDIGTEYGLVPPVDESEYLRWREESLAGAAELELPWQSLTAEHIQSLTTAG